MGTRGTQRMTAPAGQGPWRRSTRRLLVPSQSPQGRREKCRLRELVPGSAHTPSLPPASGPGPSAVTRVTLIGMRAGSAEALYQVGSPRPGSPGLGSCTLWRPPGREPWTCIRPWGSGRLSGGRGRQGCLPGPPPSLWGARRGGGGHHPGWWAPEGQEEGPGPAVMGGVPRRAGGGPGDCVLEGENVTL